MKVTCVVFMLCFLGSCEKEKSESFAPLEFGWEKVVGEFYYPPLVDEEMVYVISTNDNAYALHLSDGEIAWQTNSYGHPDVKARILSDDSSLFYPVVWGAVASMSKENGQVKWHYDQTTANYHKIAVSSESVIVCGFGDYNVLCVDKTNGALKWKETIFGNARSTPLIEDGRVYLSTFDNVTVSQSEAIGRLYCLDFTTGDVLFDTTYGISGQGGANDDIVIVGGQVIVTSANYIYGLDKNTGAVVWNISIPVDTSLGGEAIVSPLLSESTNVFGATVAGAMLAINVDDREVLWYKKHVNSTAAGKPVIIDDLYLQRFAGTEIVAADKNTGTLVWKALSGLNDPFIDSQSIIGHYGNGRIRLYESP
jgi:outer membrane protein assembly factor BamB